MSKENYRILVADDEFFNREIICILAEEAGCAVDQTSNGWEVLSKLENNSYELILMDCRMPEIDGYEATRTLLAMGNDTPVIGLSASTLDEDKKEGLRSGMNKFIEKPLTTDRLEDLIKQYPAHDH